MEVVKINYLMGGRRKEGWAGLPSPARVYKVAMHVNPSRRGLWKTIWNRFGLAHPVPHRVFREFVQQVVIGANTSSRLGDSEWRQGTQTLRPTSR